MGRIEKVYLIANLLSNHVGDKCSFFDLMIVANMLLEIAHSPALKPDEDEIEYRNVVDAFENPFEVLEFEFKNMRLGESSEWDIE